LIGMQNLLGNLINTFIPIFVAIDIFAVLPFFVSITEGMTVEKRHSVERDSVLTALLVGLSFIALGEGIFNVLGITPDDFKIAGGLLLLIFAVLDLIGLAEVIRQPSGKLGVVPIGVPLVVGPAVLTTILVLVDHYGILPTVASFIVNLLIVWISFKAASTITRALGKGGILVISKIMALLLASIAVMMIRLGIENILLRHVRG
jgi:multiple antibiotic resistance protein